MAEMINLQRSSREAAAWGEPGAQAPVELAGRTEPRSGGTSAQGICWNWWPLVPLALVCTAMATPYFVRHGFLPVGLALQRGFALVCRQRPERSFWISGGSVAVCSRCLGIYLGAALGLLFRTSRTIAVRLLIAAAVLNLLDAGCELAGLHGNWLAPRFVLGLVLGAGGALLISSSIPRVSNQPS